MERLSALVQQKIIMRSARAMPREGLVLDARFEQAKQLAASVADARVRFFVASVYDAPLPQQHFDIALFCGVLGHIPDPELALRHAFNVLKPGGVIAVRELAKNGDWAGGCIGRPSRRSIRCMLMTSR